VSGSVGSMGGLMWRPASGQCRSGSSSVLSHSEQDSDTLQLALTHLLPPHPMTGHSAPHTAAAAAGS